MNLFWINKNSGLIFLNMVWFLHFSTIAVYSYFSFIKVMFIKIVLKSDFGLIFNIFWYNFWLFNSHKVNKILLRYNLWLLISKYGLGWDKSLPWPRCFTAIIGIHLPYQPKTYDRTWLRSVRWITCFHDVAIILL